MPCTLRLVSQVPRTVRVGPSSAPSPTRRRSGIPHEPRRKVVATCWSFCEGSLWAGDASDASHRRRAVVHRRDALLPRTSYIPGIPNTGPNPWRRPGDDCRIVGTSGARDRGGGGSANAPIRVSRWVAIPQTTLGERARASSSPGAPTAESADPASLEAEARADRCVARVGLVPNPAPGATQNSRASKRRGLFDSGRLW